MGNRESTEIDLSGRQLESLNLDEVEANQNVSRIILRQNHLTRLHQDITLFKHLTELSLRDNRLTEFPIEVIQLKKLAKLSISYNRISKLPDDIGQMKSLQLLSIAGNRLTSLPFTIGKLDNLASLDAQRNHLTMLPKSIGSLKRLEILLVQRNNLQQLPVTMFQLFNLKTLNISYNQLIYLPDSLCALVKLQELHCSGNRIVVLPPYLFTSLQQLTNFDAHTNQLRSIPVDIGQAQKLKRLNVAINKLSKIPVELCRLQSLEWLNLNDNQLESLPVEIGELRIVKKIGLVQNKITELPCEMARLSRLAKIDVRRNQIRTFPSTFLFMNSVTVLADDNPLLQEQKLLDPEGFKKPNSLMELAARVYIRELEAQDHSRFVMQLGLAPHQTPKTLPTGPQPIVPRSVEKYFDRPSLCHCCVGPILKESIRFVDLRCLSSSRAPVPIEFHFCSHECFYLNMKQGYIDSTPGGYLPDRSELSRWNASLNNLIKVRPSSSGPKVEPVGLLWYQHIVKTSRTSDNPSASTQATEEHQRRELETY